MGAGMERDLSLSVPAGCARQVAGTGRLTNMIQRKVRKAAKKAEYLNDGRNTPLQQSPMGGAGAGAGRLFAPVSRSDGGQCAKGGGYARHYRRHGGQGCAVSGG